MRLPRLRGQNALRKALKILPAIWRASYRYFMNLEERKLKKRIISLLLCLCMVFSLLPTVVFASEAETTFEWDQSNGCYLSTTGSNEPQSIKVSAGLPETLKTLYNNIYAAETESAKKEAIQAAKTAGTISADLADRLERLVHVYTGDELASGVSLQDGSFTATLNGDELVISGTGALPTYTRYNDDFWAPADNSVAMRPWNTEKLGDKAVSSVRFAPGITEVGAYAFYYQKRDDITSATFNRNLKIHLPDSLEKMSQATFMSLNASDIAVPSSVTTLSTRLFGTLSRLYVLGDPEIVVPSASTSSFAVGSGTTVYAAKDSKLSKESGITNMTLEKVDAIGACGTEEGYTTELVWMVQGDTLTIAAMDGGNGVMANYTDETPAPWNAYASQIRKIVLSAGVANIGTNAFAGLNSLTNVTVPDSVKIDKNDESPFGTTLNLISFSFNEGSSFANWLKEKGIDHSADVDTLGRKKLTKAENELFHAYIGETDIAAKMTKDGTLTIYPTYSLFNNTEVPRIEGYRQDNTAFPWFNEAYGTTFNKNDYKGSTKDLVNLKEIVWADGITDTGAYLFNDANNWPTGAVKFRIPDSVTKIGGALIGNKSAGTTCVIPENVTSVGFWFGGRNAENVYILNPNLTDFPVVMKDETPSSSGGDSMARNIGCGFDYTVHVKEDSAAHKKLATGNYTIQPHTDMGACGAAPYSSEVFWLYDEDTKTLTIKGSGKMADYASASEAPWSGYDVGKIVVEDGVTHIGAYAFAGFVKLRQNSADVTLPEGIDVAGTAFAKSDDQGRDPLPLTSDLYYNAYIGNTTIAAKMSTDGVITIYPTDTSNDTKVPGIIGYQGDNTLYPWYAVYGQTFDKEHWDGTGVHASEIKEIVFADGLTEIGGYLFNDVKGMPTSVKVHIPDTVTKVGGALVGTKNHGASIATGELMTGVGFWYAGKATNVYILNPDMKGIPFPATGDNADLTRTIAHATGDKVAVHVKEGSAAYNTLTKEGTVYTNVITHTDLGACGVAPYSSETFWTYDEGSKTLTVLGDGAIKDYANASDAPWSSRNVETLVVQDGITRIGNNAFAALKKLKIVNVDGSVTEVADTAFATENDKIVGSLKNTQFLTSSAAMKAWLEEHGTSALGTSGVCGNYRWSVESGVLTIKVNVTDADTTDVLGAGGKTAAISDVIAEGAPDWVAYKSIITKVQLGYGITGIGANAFKDMPVLASVELPSTLEAIGAEAFVNTPKLTKLYLPKNATEVAENAFGTESSDAKNLTIQISPIAPDPQKNLKSQGNTTITVDSSKNLNVLLIGNSYFGALSGYLKDIARGLGATDAMIANYYFGGYSGNLESYVNYIKAGKVSYQDADKYSGYKENGNTNHSYNNNPLSMGIEAEDWDYVVMETWGKNEPAGANGVDKKLSQDPNLTTLKEYILKYAPQAEVSLYHVYSCRYLAEKEEPVETLTEQWQRYVDGADDGLASIVTHVIPASTLIQNARLTYLNADGGDLLRKPKPTDGSNPDITHLNLEGDYINAIMMYETLTGKSAAHFDHGTFDNHKEAFYHKLVDVTSAAGMKKLTYAYVEHNNTITYYDSLAEAANAAVAGDTLSLLAMPKSETPLTLASGITVETFGSSEDHTIVLTAGGRITATGLIAFAGCTVDNAAATTQTAEVNPETGVITYTDAYAPDAVAAAWTAYIEESGLGSATVPGSTMKYSEVPEIQAAMTKGYSDIWAAKTETEAQAALAAAKANLLATVKAYVKFLLDTVYNNGSSTVLGDTAYTLSESAYETASSEITAATTEADVLTAYNTALSKQTSKEHPRMTKTDAVAATCTATGNSAYWTCNGCGKYFSDENGTKEIEKDSWAISATGHSWGAWATDGADNHKRVCKNDESHFETAPHTWNEGVVTTKATCTTAGVKTYTCSDCGATKTEPIDATGHDLTYHPAKAPTETAEGNIEYWECSKCGKKFKDKDCAEEVTNVTLPKLTPAPVTPVKPSKPAKPSFNPDAGKTKFVDVSDNAWYASAVDYVVDKGLMNGTGSNKFSPNADTTRGMIVTILARLSGQSTAGTPWYAAGQRWAMEYEISDGTNMTGAITREQLVTMLFRYAVKNGLEAVTLSENLTQFTDASDISAWAVSAMQWAVGQGLIQGSNGQLRPQANASRAEVATILMRFCELMKK